MLPVCSNSEIKALCTEFKVMQETDSEFELFPLQHRNFALTDTEHEHVIWSKWKPHKELYVTGKEDTELRISPGGAVRKVFGVYLI